MKHTKGPWNMAGNNGAHVFIRGNDRGCENQTLAQVWLQGNEFSDANAKLIVLAPELLQCLLDIKKEIQTTPEILDSELLGLILIKIQNTLQGLGE